MRVFVRIHFRGEQNAFFLQRIDDEIDNFLRGRRLAGQLAESGKIEPRFVERRNRRQANLLAKCEVLFAAAGGDVNDAGAFGFADVFPTDDAMGLLARDSRGPFLLFDNAGDVGRIPVRRVLRFEFVEGTVVGAADQFFALDLADDLEAFLRLLLEELFERLQLGNALDPFLGFELFFEPGRLEGRLADVINLAALLDLEIDEVRD